MHDDTGETESTCQPDGFVDGVHIFGYGSIDFGILGCEGPDVLVDRGVFLL